MNALARDIGPVALPHSIEAEQALLGAVLLQNDCIDAVAGRVDPADFFEPVHRQIFEVACDLVRAGKVATPVTLKRHLAADLDVAGLTLNQYLARLAAEATTTINAPDYADVVRENAQRRALIALAQRLGSGAHGSGEIGALVGEGLNALDELLDSDRRARRPVMISEALTEAVDRIATAYQHDGAIPGISWGYSDLDSLTGGLHRGEMIVVAGRPGMGKSALAFDAGCNAAEAGYGVAQYSLEMPRDSLALRKLSSRIGIPYFKLRSGKFEEYDFGRIIEAARDVGRLPFLIDDRSSLTISDLASSVRSTAKRFRRAGKELALVIVDYMQLLQPGDRYSGSRVNEVSEISAGLKRLSRDQNVAVMALSQLSREVEKRDNKRPLLSDLRESGTIEQDADTVIFLYREEYYLRQRKPQEGHGSFPDWQASLEKCFNKMEVNVAKQRYGPLGTVEVRFDAATNTISNLARRSEGTEQLEFSAT
jgi:replicative DNA helicase